MIERDAIEERLLGKEKKDCKDVFYFLYLLKGPVLFLEIS